MGLVLSFLIITVVSTIATPLLQIKGRAILVYITIILNSLITCIPAVEALSGYSSEVILPGAYPFGDIPLRIDPLAGWFIIIINLIFALGGFYGIFYLKNYSAQKHNIALHGIFFILLHASLLAITMLQNSVAFIIAWEIMTISAFITIIFDHNKPDTVKAGINFLIQSHISVLFLVLGFIWAASKTGSYDFKSITDYTVQNRGATSMVLFLCFAAGFAIKAGFVPFHTWLPHAHPVAPAHISGMMSGIIIKIGIFGLLRMITVISSDYLTIGYIILSLSVISGLYGVMLAIIQHNLKKLLAYHSIENIGIIGIGIGLGCIGLGKANNYLAVLGFAGALLHTLNHALFKSLLFYTAGNVYQSTHTMNIERLGGIIKSMPHTAMLFILAAMAICGLPPFNGFVSEFIIYAGLYSWLQDAHLAELIIIIFSVLGLVMIGGLAILCFTKASGMVFLGSPREELSHKPVEVSSSQLIPLYITGSLIIAIGLFPQLFLKILASPVEALAGTPMIIATDILDIMKNVSRAAALFISLTVIIFLIRSIITRKQKRVSGPTWGCGYVAPTPKIQYTGSSFARTYSKLFSFVLQIFKPSDEIKGIYPEETSYETSSYDKIEKWFVDAPVRVYRLFMNRFLFIQNGKLQMYIVYGIVFIVAVIMAPIIWNYINILSDFFKQL